MRYFLIFGLGLALAACAPEATEVIGPSGRTAFAIFCTGKLDTMADCYSQAGQLCPAGYDIVNATATGQGRFVGGVMTVECR